VKAKQIDTRKNRIRNIASWRKAEFQVANMLRHRGVSCDAIGGQNKPWDIITENGQKIEVKFASFNKKRQWHCNLRDIQWTHADWFVLVLAGLPSASKHDRACLYVILRPIHKKAIGLTVRSLFNRFAKNVNDWQRIVRAEGRANEQS
jgi:hypothetical protein